MGSQPAAPDPYATANAQQNLNDNSAIAQNALNDVSQVTPYGTVKYDQTGSTDVGGNTIPQYTATTTLSQPLQNLVNSNISNAQGNSNLEGQVQTEAANQLTTPLDLSTNASMAQTDKLNEATMDPQWQEQQDSLLQKLQNQGVTLGSEAYKDATTNFSNQKNQAYDQMYVADQGQADQNILAQYNEPLNELNALSSGSQISQPGVGQTASTASAQISPANEEALVESNYQSAMQGYQSEMGGLFGLGGSLLGGAAKMFSDRRDKTDIKKLGKDKQSGVDMYAYRYKDDPKSYPKVVGPMAQDLQKKGQAKVGEIGGHKVVSFGIGGSRRAA